MHKKMKFREFAVMLNEESCRQLFNALIEARDEFLRSGATINEISYICETASRLCKVAIEEGWKL